jgi:hypothetical protein
LVRKQKRQVEKLEEELVKRPEEDTKGENKNESESRDDV